MAAESTDAVLLRHLPSLYHVGAAGTLTDGQLLERFLAGSGEVAEAAFTALLERHGPMVLRVCRQVLGDMDDAHDAFQATFLVLVRHAGSLRKCECVASWLYGVAQRVALRARVDLARRRVHERRSAEMAADSFESATQFEGWPELHEEIARLPEKYRAPIILCYFEGLTTELAAQKLGCPLGTVLSRLARARDRLRTQLTRRGMALSVGLLASGLSAKNAEAAVPPALSELTVKTALRFAASKALSAAVVSATVTTLTEGALRAMVWTKLKGIAVALLAIAACVLGGTGVIAYQASATPEWQRANARKPASQAPVQVARSFPDDAPPTLAPAPQALTTSTGSDEPGTAPRVLEARLRLALQREKIQQAEHQVGRGATLAVVEAHGDVEILKAQLEAQREDLRDELELLEARQGVKEAELQGTVILGTLLDQPVLKQLAATVNENRQLAANQRRVKQAELNESQVRIKQTQRRLNVLDKIAKGLPALPAAPPAPPPAAAPAPVPSPAARPEAASGH